MSTSIKKICDAMAALAAAIPGTGNNTMISLHGCDGVAIRMLVENGGHRDTHSEGAEEWDVVDLYVGSVHVCAFGKHRPIATAALDSTAVDTALALAEEAVRP